MFKGEEEYLGKVRGGERSEEVFKRGFKWVLARCCLLSTCSMLRTPGVRAHPARPFRCALQGVLPSTCLPAFCAHLLPTALLRTTRAPLGLAHALPPLRTGAARLLIVLAAVVCAPELRFRPRPFLPYFGSALRTGPVFPRRLRTAPLGALTPLTAPARGSTGTR